MTRIIAGTLRGRLLKTPKGSSTRPTSEKVRGALFNSLGEAISDTTFLDICAGSGAMGIEAFSRGAAHVIFIENDKAALHTIHQNIASLIPKEQQPEFSILGMELFQGLSFLERKNRKIDILFIDPPYEFHGKKKVIQEEEPLVMRLVTFLDKSPLLREGSRLFIEEGGAITWPASLQRLFLVKERSYGNSFLFEFICRSSPDWLQE